MEEQKEGVAGLDQSGHTTVNEYTVIHTLGRGSYGKVKLCKTEEALFAAKVFKNSVLNKKQYIFNAEGEMIETTGYSDVEREIAIMKKLTHTNVTRLHDVIYVHETEKLYILMEYCSKGPLMEFDEDLQKFYFPWSDSAVSDEFIWKIFRDAVCGLEYLHYHNIAHRDIKPQNILINHEYSAKLADFGQSHLLNDEVMKKRSLGTYFFNSPECFGEVENVWVQATDIWALGITFYVVLFGVLPFTADSIVEVFEKVNSFELIFPENRKIHNDLKVLIERMLDKNPETRIKIFEIIQNPWLNKNSDPILPTNEEKILPTDLEINSSIRLMKNFILAVIFI